ncbi:hypothetical protein Droror1_Dr00025281 [Drosera rotundifolia]
MDKPQPPATAVLLHNHRPLAPLCRRSSHEQEAKGVVSLEVVPHAALFNYRCLTRWTTSRREDDVNSSLSSSAAVFGCEKLNSEAGS